MAPAWGTKTGEIPLPCVRHGDPNKWPPSQQPFGDGGANRQVAIFHDKQRLEPSCSWMFLVLFIVSLNCHGLPLLCGRMVSDGATADLRGRPAWGLLAWHLNMSNLCGREAMLPSAASSTHTNQSCWDMPHLTFSKRNEQVYHVGGYIWHLKVKTTRKDDRVPHIWP